MIVQEAPSLIISLFGSLGHGVAFSVKKKKNQNSDNASGQKYATYFNMMNMKIAFPNQ